MAPLTARTRMLRKGKRIQLVELELDAQDRTWICATLLRCAWKATKRSWSRWRTPSLMKRKVSAVCWQNLSALLEVRRNQARAQSGCRSSRQ
jgi:hypothetical protein